MYHINTLEWLAVGIMPTILIFILCLYAIARRCNYKMLALYTVGLLSSSIYIGYVSGLLYNMGYFL